MLRAGLTFLGKVKCFIQYLVAALSKTWWHQIRTLCQLSRSDPGGNEDFCSNNAEQFVTNKSTDCKNFLKAAEEETFTPNIVHNIEFL